MKKHYRNVFLAGGLSVSLILGACSTKNASSEETQVVKETPIQVGAITNGNLTITNEVIAKVVTDSTVDIYPKTVGEIIKVNIQKGDLVQKGDILAVLNNSDQMLAIQMEETTAENAQNQYEQAILSKKQAEAAVQNAKDGVKQAEANLQKVKDGQTKGPDNSGLSLQQPEINLEDAQINFDRMEELYENGEVSEQAFEQVQSVLEQAKIALEQAQLQNDAVAKQTEIQLMEQALEQAKVGLLNADQQLELSNVGIKQAQVGVDSNDLRIQQAQNQLDHFNIVATTSGEVTAVHAKVGQFVNTSTPFTQIVDVQNIKAEALLSADQLALFKKDEEVKVEIPSLSQTYNAKIQYISNVADQAGFYLLEASVENEGGTIKPGMIAKVQHESEVVGESLLVPTDAVIEQGDETFLYRVEENKAVKIPVTIIQAQTEFTAIEGEGLQENSMIVIKGQTTLSDGNQVRIIGEE
ncbi:efflux RND transporter periplasmic adaptor subunit [Bacillus sp. V3B]|uniref:efflux RND transporter periplasmic adaptor subunit n=1 Tax=Bacillus sp. V3B TaxID=2804915 RepID=UPI00210B513F|nr:efflux RND transporter periplasmic adaptor subunit [Bacillus sp. V3B]MCQ6277110.1 efflux RND transporter periplasmic adaptor subunit [Bacillus sp. V3B]